MLMRLVAVGIWLWDSLESIVDGIEHWFRTRRWEQAPVAVPAGLAAVVLLVVLFGQRSKTPLAVAEPYRQALHAALEARDYVPAELYLRKLTKLNAADDRNRLRFAMLARSLGKTDEALDQIAKLSPQFKVGFPLKSHSLLGTLAAEAGRMPEAKVHLEQALQEDPDNPALLNNLAWVLTNCEPPELQRALELANASVRQLPGNADARETRGQILLRLRQSQAAIADLEWALPRIKPDSLAAVHAALDQAQRQLSERSDHPQLRGPPPPPE